MGITVIEVLLLVIGIYLVLQVVKLNEKYKGMSYKLDLIVKKLEIGQFPIDEILSELIREGEDIKAIKLVRETLGLTLLEGKTYIENLKSEMEAASE